MNPTKKKQKKEQRHSFNNSKVHKEFQQKNIHFLFNF